MELIIGLAALVVAIAALRRNSELSERVKKLERAVHGLMQQLAAAPPPSTASEPTPPPPSIAAAGPSPTPAPAPAEVTRPLPIAARVADSVSPGPSSTPADAPRVPPPSLPPAPVPPSQPTPPTRSFEERFGTRWVVWVGGLALALGGLFLVQYSIEAGLLGPGVRITLGLLLAAGLLGAGEWSRRHDAHLGLANMPTANIPAILAGAGIVVAFGTVYAAHALYGFLDSGIAFVILGLVALGTLAAALLHGPMLAGLGLAGAYVTPVLVASNMPNYWALYIYLAAVTAANFALASARHWRWLAITALVFSLLWFFPGIADTRVDPTPPHAFHLVAGYLLAAAFLVSNLFLGPSGDNRFDPISSASIALYCMLAALFVFVTNFDQTAFMVFAGLAIANLVVAWRAEPAIGAVAVSAVLVALVCIDWTVALVATLPAEVAIELRSALEATARATRTSGQMATGSVIAGLIALAGFAAQGRSSRAFEPMVWATAAVFAPIAMLIGLYLELSLGRPSFVFALAALALAALAALATELLTRRSARPGLASAAAIFAVGSVVTLAFALSFSLDGGDLTVGLALMVPGIAYVAARRPIRMLRWLAAGLALLVTIRIGVDPYALTQAGPTPFFNWLIYGYGLPALAFWLGGLLLRRRADDGPTHSVEAAAVLFTVLFAFFEIRHFVYGGNILAARVNLLEIALQVSTGIAMAIGLEWLRRRSGSIVHNVAAIVTAALAVGGTVAGLLLLENPIFRSIAVGGPVLNLLFLAYALPGILFVTLSQVARTTRPELYRVALALLGIGLFYVYLALEVRRAFHGPIIALGSVEIAEFAMQLSIAIIIAIKLEWLRRIWQDTVLDIAPVALAVFALVGLAGGLVLVMNPVFSGVPVRGGPIFNELFLAYAIPAALLGVLGLIARPQRPSAFVTTVGLAGIGLALLFLTLEVRRGFHGANISWGPMLAAEQYTFSAVWLVFGVLLLGAGLAARSQSMRLASAAVVLGTIGKVFLVDLSQLTGIYRALSFIGLGLVLVAIGALYQRLLFPRRSDTGNPTGNDGIAPQQ